MSDYTPQVWHDSPSTDTPVSAARLEHIEAGLAEHGHPSGTPFVLRGPFTLAHTTPSIDVGVDLWTPAVGDFVVGGFAVTSEAFDAAGERLLIGTAAQIAGGDGFQVGVEAAELQNVGYDVGLTWAHDPLWWFLSNNSPAVARMLAATTIKAKANVGGNTTGACQLFVVTVPASAYT